MEPMGSPPQLNPEDVNQNPFPPQEPIPPLG
jgi:hypothetical protein